mmetsp:Transcript_18860/g.56532  ORF Transcript_18860/g.56532 Transcript_18860/m.56532 type:complete len:223 (+) Transcript_18860:2-670(+)
MLAAEAEEAEADAEAEAEAELARAEAEAADLPSELHEAAEAGDAGRVQVLLEGGADPALRHVRYGFRVPYDVAKTREVRNAFRKARAELPERWDWAAAHVPQGLTEQEEADREERERAKAREKKKKAEKARKERRKQEEAERAAAAALLVEATAGADLAALSASIEKAQGVGCDGAELERARERLAALQFEATDPAAIARREREKRAAAAEARLNRLTGGAP